MGTHPVAALLCSGGAFMADALPAVFFGVMASGRSRTKVEALLTMANLKRPPTRPRGGVGVRSRQMSAPNRLPAP
jgi:hypothetical protein